MSIDKRILLYLLRLKFEFRTPQLSILKKSIYYHMIAWQKKIQNVVNLICLKSLILNFRVEIAIVLNLKDQKHYHFAISLYSHWVLNILHLRYMSLNSIIYFKKER